ncbi:uncharacterized protein LOC116254676 [Nymphaea colorata]|nr:uncharacterized protein LOC116254676 [Nymphaea colorata]XP_031486075.1 uncharacterized protein LOC116254676 [Nymphaea colorata]
MDDIKFMKRPAVMGPVLRKERKKQVKDELDRLKLAEKKKRRLEKALAASAAIRLELEKKKQKKKEEQQRLDEEGAAIAEAVALHVLMDEKPEEHYTTLLDKKEMISTQVPANISVDFLTAPGNAAIPVCELDSMFPYQRCWKNSLGSRWDSDFIRSDCKQRDWERNQPVPRQCTGYDAIPGNFLGASDNGMWNANSCEGIFQVAEISGIIASQAVASLRIAEDVCSANLTAPDSGCNSHCIW